MSLPGGSNPFLFFFFYIRGDPVPSPTSGFIITPTGRAIGVGSNSQRHYLRCVKDVVGFEPNRASNSGWLVSESGRFLRNCPRVMLLYIRNYQYTLPILFLLELCPSLFRFRNLIAFSCACHF